MAILVQKFGGSSLADMEKIQGVARHLAGLAEIGERVVVVVSAMGHQTNHFLQQAQSLHQTPPKRELDLLLSAGERITMGLLSIAIQALGVKAQSFTGSQSGIITDECHGSAKIKEIRPFRIEQALKDNPIVIVAGFQGVSHNSKDVTTLGRGGSDLTAVALTHTLGSKSCQLFKEFDGIYTADPRIVEDAKVVKNIDWSSMTTLSHLGAKVIHARAAAMAEKFSIPIEVKSALNPQQQGTLIEGHAMESTKIISICSQNNLNLSTVSSDLPLVKLSQMSEWLATQDAPPAFQHLSAASQQIQISHLIPRKLNGAYHDYVRKLHEDGASAYQVETLEHMASVSLVGHGFTNDPTLLGRVLTKLEITPIKVDCQASHITLVVPDNDVTFAVERLHELVSHGEPQTT